MRVSLIFTLLLIVLGVAVGGLVYFAGKVPGALWLAAGVGITGVVLLSVFYRSVMRPLRVIANGVDLLRAQDFSSRLARVGQREADRIVDMFNGIMVSLRTERLKLREQNHFLDLLTDVSPMGVIQLSFEGRVTSANPAAELFLDVPRRGQLEGKRLSEIDSELGRVLDALEQDEVKVVRLNDSMVYRCYRLSFMDRGQRHPFLLLERLTEEVMRAEKKSYEMVIRMIAHEVNNSLAGITSVLEVAAEATGDTDPDISEALTACRRRCHDMGDFITKFAGVVKIPDPVNVEVDVPSMLRTWLPVLESLCVRTGSTFRADIPDISVDARLDPVLIEQAVTNIVKNAAESAGEGGHVTLRFDADKRRIEVTDDGPGIDTATSDKLFTPFFTTKSDGHGLGLLLVSEVLNRHRFKFSLSTDADRLTRFKIELRQRF